VTKLGSWCEDCERKAKKTAGPTDGRPGDGGDEVGSGDVRDLEIDRKFAGDGGCRGVFPRERRDLRRVGSGGLIAARA